MSTSEPIDLDYDRLLAEIDAEARARRESGDYPPGFEAELDALFARFAPAAAAEDVETVLEQAAHSAAIDAEIPVESRLPGGTVVKRGIARSIGWYHAFLVSHFIEFSSAITHAVRILSQRTQGLETAVAASLRSRHEADRVAGTERSDSNDPMYDAAAAVLSDCSGRVLVAECGDGALLETLTRAGLDAYGVDARRTLVDSVRARGLDAHPDDVREHLGVVEPDTLGAIVCAGFVERRPPGELMDLLDLVLSRLDGNGRLVIVSRGARAVAVDEPILADLAPGHPLHPDTWKHLLAERGWGAEVAYLEPMLSGAARDVLGDAAELFGAACYVIVASSLRS